MRFENQSLKAPKSLNEHVKQPSREKSRVNARESFKGGGKKKATRGAKRRTRKRIKDG